MDELKRLLERWAKLEPGRCIVSGKHDRDYKVVVSPESLTCVFWDIDGGDYHEAYILKGVMDAIRARGWNFIIHGYSPVQGWDNAATVWQDHCRRGESGTDAFNLLSAYVQMLEITQP